jgi:hypothetical protein
VTFPRTLRILLGWSTFLWAGSSFWKVGESTYIPLLESRSDILVRTTLLKHVCRRDEVVHRYLAKRHLKFN